MSTDSLFGCDKCKGVYFVKKLNFEHSSLSIAKFIYLHTLSCDSLFFVNNESNIDFVDNWVNNDIYDSINTDDPNQVTQAMGYIYLNKKV